MGRLQLRDLIFAGLLALPATAWGERARSADSFVDAIGVNTHLHYEDTPYNDFPKVKSALLDLGIRHIRDGLVDSTWQPYYDRLNELGREGIHALLIRSIPSRYNEHYQPSPERIIPTLSKLADSVEGIEGTNEPDLSHRDGADWVAQTRENQREIFKAVKGDATFGRLPVVGPSVCFSDQPELGDQSDYLDYGNSHPYPGGRPVSEEIDTELAKQKAVSGKKPLMITESGYHTAVATTDGHLPVSESAEAKYLPRLFAEYFRRGVVRSYDYQLLDQAEGEATDPETHFGLLRHDFSRRPAYGAMKNLIALLSDKGGEAAADELDFTLTAADGGKLPDTVHHALLRKANGWHYLLVWNDVRSWDPKKRVDVTVEPVKAVLTLKTPPGRAIF